LPRPRAREQSLDYTEKCSGIHNSRFGGRGLGRNRAFVRARSRCVACPHQASKSPLNPVEGVDFARRPKLEPQCAKPRPEAGFVGCAPAKTVSSFLERGSSLSVRWSRMRSTRFPMASTASSLPTPNARAVIPAVASKEILNGFARI